MDAETKTLFDMASKARANAFAPISHYTVGAAVLTEQGQYFAGCNVESATLTQSTHAETNAIDAAVAAGERKIKKILIITPSATPPFPCALCRQKILEFSDNAEVIGATPSGDTAKKTIWELYPDTFSLKDIGK